MDYNPFLSIEVIGKRLHELRQAAGMNQKQFAAHIGVDQSWVSRMERGEIEDPSVTILQRAVLCFAIGMDELFGSAMRWEQTCGRVRSQYTDIPDEMSQWLSLSDTVRAAVQAASTVIVTGSMGSGKTTWLMALLAGVEPESIDLLAFSPGAAWQSVAAERPLDELIGSTLAHARACGHTLWQSDVPLSLERATRIGEAYQDAQVLLVPEISDGALFNSPAPAKLMGTLHAQNVQQAYERIRLMQLQADLNSPASTKWLDNGPLIVHTERTRDRQFNIATVCQLFPGLDGIAVHDVEVGGYISRAA